MQSTYIDQLINSPERYLFGLVGIAFFSFVLGTVIPGIVAWRYGVFSREDLLKKLSGALELQKLEARQSAYRGQINQIDQQLAASADAIGTTNKVKTLIALRQFLETARKQAQSEYYLVPFYPSDLSYMWWLTYTSLATLWFLVPYQSEVSGAPPNWNSMLLVAAATIGVWLMGEIPILVRNKWKLNEGGKIYSFINLQVSPGSFWMARFNNFLFYLLLGLVWYRWIQHLHYTQTDSLTACHLQRLFRDSFAGWQAASIVLALGFFVFTSIYWKRIVVLGDKRYLIQGVLIHAIWGLTWCVISLPVLKLFRNLLSRGTAIPISHWNWLGSVAAAAISFVYPILNKTKD